MFFCSKSWLNSKTLVYIPSLRQNYWFIDMTFAHFVAIRLFFHSINLKSTYVMKVWWGVLVKYFQDNLDESLITPTFLLPLVMSYRELNLTKDSFYIIWWNEARCLTIPQKIYIIYDAQNCCKLSAERSGKLSDLIITCGLVT